MSNSVFIDTSLSSTCYQRKKRGGSELSIQSLDTQDCTDDFVFKNSSLDDNFDDTTDNDVNVNEIEPDHIFIYSPQILKQYQGGGSKIFSPSFMKTESCVWNDFE